MGGSGRYATDTKQKWFALTTMQNPHVTEYDNLIVMTAQALTQASGSNVPKTDLMVNVAGPTFITLSPIAARAGSIISVHGAGFHPADSAGSLTGVPVIAPVCYMQFGAMVGEFKVGNVAAGTYQITAIGSQGDRASATLTVRLGD